MAATESPIVYYNRDLKWIPREAVSLMPVQAGDKTLYIRSSANCFDQNNICNKKLGYDLALAKTAKVAQWFKNVNGNFDEFKANKKFMYHPLTETLRDDMCLLEAKDLSGFEKRLLHIEEPFHGDVQLWKMILLFEKDAKQRPIETTCYVPVMGKSGNDVSQFYVKATAHCSSDEQEIPNEQMGVKVATEKALAVIDWFANSNFDYETFRRNRKFIFKKYGQGNHLKYLPRVDMQLVPVGLMDPTERTTVEECLEKKLAYKEKSAEQKPANTGVLTAYFDKVDFGDQSPEEAAGLKKHNE